MRAIQRSLLVCLLVVVCTTGFQVEVYYQAFTPACVTFITEQLHPTYMAVNKLPDASFLSSYMSPPNMRVKLVPYGVSFTQQLQNDTWNLKCIDAIPGCYYNKIHACAIDRLNDEWKSLNYINCLIRPHMYDVPHLCAKQTCISDVWMPSCVNTVDGDELLARYGQDTEALNLTLTQVSLPIVTFEGVYDEEEQQRARENLLSLVCEKMNNQPEVCAAPRVHRVMTHKNFGTYKYYPIITPCDLP